MSGQRKQGGWRCQYCGHVLTTRRELYKHYPSCEEKAKLPINCKGYTWQPKQIEHALQLNKTRYEQGIRRTISNKTKKKLSDARKLYLQTHKVKYHWNGPLNRLSYAEQHFYDYVKAYCDGRIDWANNYRVGRYKLDFANLQTHVYFEVDGEQHYDEYGLMHDQQRTQKLADKGWYLLTRVRWKSYSNLNDVDKSKYRNRLLNEFVSTTANPLPSIVSNEPLVKSRKARISSQDKHGKQKSSDKSIKRSAAIAEGRIRKNGWINGVGLTNSVWEHRKFIILNCGVDLMKFGWVGRVVDATGLSKRIIERTIQRFHDEFDGKYFRRKWNPVESKT